LGSAAPLGYLLAAAGIGAIMLCFAEVGSQFRGAGGPYLYARQAFGAFIGLQVGWAAWLTRLTAGAAIANLFVDYLGEFWKDATSPIPRALLLVCLIGGLAWANVRGVKAGARISNVVTIAKLLPLALFVGIGLVMVGPGLRLDAAGTTERQWTAALLLLVYAFGGFESVLIPAAELKDPRRDLPFALSFGLVVVTGVYLAIHLVVVAAFPDAASFTTAAMRDRPVGEAARVLVGPAGPTFIAIAAILSTFGTLAAQILTAPRLLFALAEQGEFPATLAAVHPRYRTPHVAILLHAALAAMLAVFGSFVWNAVLSAVARLVTYAAVCGSLIVLRRRWPAHDAFRVPAGPLVACGGLGFCVVLVGQLRGDHLVLVAAVGMVAALNWWITRRARYRAVPPDVGSPSC
jgi:amino acid transporter